MEARKPFHDVVVAVDELPEISEGVLRPWWCDIAMRDGGQEVLDALQVSDHPPKSANELVYIPKQLMRLLYSLKMLLWSLLACVLRDERECGGGGVALASSAGWLAEDFAAFACLRCL